MVFPQAPLEMERSQRILICFPVLLHVGSTKSRCLQIASSTHPEKSLRTRYEESPCSINIFTRCQRFISQFLFQCIPFGGKIAALNTSVFMKHLDFPSMCGKKKVGTFIVRNFFTLPRYWFIQKPEAFFLTEGLKISFLPSLEIIKIFLNIFRNYKNISQEWGMGDCFLHQHKVLVF